MPEPVGDFKIMDLRGQYLAGQGLNDTSQFGEDGYIAHALERIGIKNKWCFEVGAHNGTYLSNTKRLRDDGWSAVLIENDKNRTEELLTYKSELVRIVVDKIESHSLDQILAEVRAPLDLDLGVLDIDGQEYWCWDGMKIFRPRLMLVEFGPGDSDFKSELNGKGQSGINPILEMGKEKGYFPLVSTYCNVLFCLEDQWK